MPCTVRLLFCSLTASLFFCSCSSSDPGPLSPAEALHTLQIAEGFRIELFASEPHVVDPVEMAFDANGGVYVAELLDNPEDPPAGEPPQSLIKYLEDTDGDGVIDHHTVFADRILAVEGITPWKGGLIATAAPDILFLKDTDGDHRADVRKVLYTGFATPHMEGRLSNPRFGLDNWIYVVNHSYPGGVTSPDRPDQPPVNVRSREFRFHALRGLAETSTGDAQFGQSHNEWGHWFISHNTVHLRHTVIPPGYLRRNPLLTVENMEQDISDHDRPAARVYPISRPQQWRIERTAARKERYAETQPGRIERLEGYFTASSGATVYLGDAFPEEFSGRTFVGDGAGNLVHCDIITPNGATYSASRWPENADFLASTDNWFRPVNFSNAPDGNLYVLDYYREFLEHPMFIPDAIKKRLKMDFRAGDTLGRIYRIVHEKPRSSRPLHTRLGSASSMELVDLLEHTNGWHRRTAHRLLVERQDASVVPRLRELARTSSKPQARLHALWVVEGLDSLDAALVENALSDPHPAVRENGLRLAEAFLPRLGDRAIAATRDEAPRVAFQATLTVGNLEPTRRVIYVLSDVLSRHPEDPWFRTAVLSAPAGFAAPVFGALVSRHDQFFESPSEPKQELVRAFARLVGARREPLEIERFLKQLRTAEPLRQPAWRQAALEGISAGLSLRKGHKVSIPGASSVVEEMLAASSEEVRRAAAGVAPFLELGALVKRAKEEVADTRISLERRRLAVRVLQGGSWAEVAGILESILRQPNASDLQAGAAISLASFDDPRVAEILLANWASYPTSTRDAVSELLIRHRGRVTAFVEAIADGRIEPQDIAAVTRIRLAQHPDEQIRQRVAGRLELGAGNRDQVVADYLDVLDLPAKPRHGKEVFERECANCHLRKSSRGRIGPDLSGVNNRGKEALLTSILDPSYAIEDRYRNQLLETKDGRFHDGILVAETTATIALRGEIDDVVVLKDDIAELRPSDVSLMPEGLEEAVTKQDLADLIAYLQAGL